LKPYEEHKAELVKSGKTKAFLKAVNECKTDPQLVVEMATNADNITEPVKTKPVSRKRKAASEEKIDTDEIEAPVDPAVLNPPGCPPKEITKPPKAKKVKKSEIKPGCKLNQVPEKAENPEAVAIVDPEHEYKVQHEQLLSLRYKLQKIFLTDAQPREQDFGRVDELMADVEKFPVTIDLLKSTKIGKVMKRLAALSIQNEPAHVCSRANTLLQSWLGLIDAQTTKKQEFEQFAGDLTLVPPADGPADASVAGNGDNMLEYLVTVESPHAVAQDAAEEQVRASRVKK
jgi:hypothetical protein